MIVKSRQQSMHEYGIQLDLWQSNDRLYVPGDCVNR